MTAGKDYVQQPRFLGFEPEDTLYIVGPITWLGWMPYFLVAAGIGTPLFLIYVICAITQPGDQGLARQGGCGRAGRGPGAGAEVTTLVTGATGFRRGRGRTQTG